MSQEVIRKGNKFIVIEKEKGVNLEYSIEDVVKLLNEEGKKQGLGIELKGESVDFTFMDGRPGVQVSLEDFFQIALQILRDGTGSIGKTI